MIQSCKPGCAPAGSATRFLCSTARIRQGISAASFCSCKLLGRNDECILLPCFNAQPDIFAVINCCVVALIAFSSDMLAWRADSLYSARVGVNPPLELDILRKLYYLAREINCFRIYFAC